MKNEGQVSSHCFQFLVHDILLVIIGFVLQQAIKLLPHYCSAVATKIADMG